MPSVFTLQQKDQARCCTALCQGTRTVEGQKKRFKRCLRTYLKDLRIDIRETYAMDRPSWRSKLAAGARAAEIRRITEAQRKRDLGPSHLRLCPTCGRLFRARIGLFSHLRTTVTVHQSRIRIIMATFFFFLLLHFLL